MRIKVTTGMAVLFAVFGALMGAMACSHSSGQSAETAPSSAVALATLASQTAVGPIPGASESFAGRRNPYHGVRGATTEGRALFVRFNCSGCHGGRAGGGMGPSLRDVDWMYGQTEAQIFSSIAEGRAHGMPAWGTKLTEDQVWKLVAYVQSLRTPDEPHPPSE